MVGDTLRIRRGAIALALAFSIATPGLAQHRAFAPADAGTVAAALRAIHAGNPTGALALRAQAQDVAAKKLIAWYVYSRRDGRGAFADIVAFIRDNPNWPGKDLLLRAADRSITPRTNAALLLTWYANRVPETGDGLMNAVAALTAQGKPKEALALLRRGWGGIRLTDTEEAEILKRFGSQLRAEDHAERIAYLASQGQKRLAQAFMARVPLDAAARATADVRLKLRDRALRKQTAVVEAAIAKMPATAKTDEGYLYDLMRWHRQGGRMAEAFAVANALPAKLDDPEKWWKEFDILIRQAIAARQFAAAYQLARNHRQTDGETYADAEFLAGFIAYRLLDKPAVGEKHFAAAAHETHGGWDAAKLDYWSARAAAARGDKVLAGTRLTRAARYSGTFYGQLAASELGLKELKLETASGGAPMEKFWTDDIVRAAHLLRAAGDGRGARNFALHAAWNGGWSAAQHAYLAKFVLGLTGPDYQGQTAVRLAKLAARDGAAVTAYGYPTLDLPAANSVEPALVYAVIRQESEFVATAKSWVGARGLMQLMPFTAKTEAGEAKLPYVLNRLTADPAYNLRLGTQHLARLRNYFKGSYPLMVAAYNAGAGRVDYWLARHGDPRKGAIDWPAWIELIPYDETRLYTKLVLENHAIYRLRLDDPLDLKRLTAHWQAPRPDAEDCRAMKATEVAELPIVPTSTYGIGPHLLKTHTELLANRETEGKKKPDDIPMLIKLKPDNRPNLPAC
ncbi:MAG: lytic transglycosylase domain-containing protein [Rhodospirillaceae bacterium]|nr:lytic transglycosylase domain-containing protein [Rhodospirillaceae bacterium]